MPNSIVTLAALAVAIQSGLLAQNAVPALGSSPLATTVSLNADSLEAGFDGVGLVNGGGATSVLLKDYPESKRNEMFDLIFKPKFGASVSALLVEIPGDGNSTQGSMPSHMRTRNDLNFQRGYTWWILQQAKRRNPNLVLTGMAWSAPGWVGDGKFWSKDTAIYYTNWLKGLRDVYGLEFNAIGLRNEKGVSFDFAKELRRALSSQGFDRVKIQGFDNWPKDKLAFVKDMIANPQLRDAVDIISAHTLVSVPPTDGEKLKSWAKDLNKPIWNSEEHVYKSGFEAEISIVQALNLNHVRFGTSLVVNWYDIAAVYPLEPYSETPAALLARSPWSGGYTVRESLWGYAHYGQFTAPGWHYLENGSGELAGGGSYVSLKSPGNDYSIVIETKDAKAPQNLRFSISGLSPSDVTVWKSNAEGQFKHAGFIKTLRGMFSLMAEPNTIYSLSTTRGQQKGSFSDAPLDKAFPFPYRDTFDEYASPERYGYLPHFTADIDEIFEITDRPDRKGKCLRQVIARHPISWAPEWKPYTIIGDDQWRDYEISADVYLNAGDSGGIMGRVNDVGSGYGTVPKGYYFELTAEGTARLVVSRGKKDKRALVGDAEQQALIQNTDDPAAGGEAQLAITRLAAFNPKVWHKLSLQFRGNDISAWVDGRKALTGNSTLYSHGLGGLMAGGDEQVLSTPYFDNLIIKPLDTPDPKEPTRLSGVSPIYGGGKPKKR
jgi:galactosylceramidase